MNTDIRLSVGFASHPKTVKLIRRLGHEGVFSLLTLWIWAAQNRGDGVLTGMDEEDVAIAAAWGGEPEHLLRTLLALRFLERRDGNWCLHDWAEHQPYVMQEPLRRERARKAALARWGADSARPETPGPHGPAGPDGSDGPDEEEGAGRAPTRLWRVPDMPDACAGNAPIPTDPVEEDHTLTSFECVSAPDGANRPRRSDPDPAPPCPQARIVALYHELLPEHRRVAVLSAKRRGALKARWADVGRRLRARGGPDGRAERLDWLRRFFAEVAASDFLTGRLPGRDGRTYMVDFDKLMSPGGFAGVIEGKYRNREAG